MKSWQREKSNSVLFDTFYCLFVWTIAPNKWAYTVLRCWGLSWQQAVRRIWKPGSSTLLHVTTIGLREGQNLVLVGQRAPPQAWARTTAPAFPLMRISHFRKRWVGVGKWHRRVAIVGNQRVRNTHKSAETANFYSGGIRYCGCRYPSPRKNGGSRINDVLSFLSFNINKLLFFTLQ